MTRTQSKQKDYTKVPHTTNLWKHRGGAYYSIRKVDGVSKKKRLSKDLATAKRMAAQLVVTGSRVKGEATFEKTCNDFLAANANKAEGTIRNYNWVIKRCREESNFFKQPLNRIIAGTFQTFVAKLNIDPVGNNNLLRILKQICDFAVINGTILENPIPKISKSARKKVVKVPQQIPTHEQAIAIIADIRKEKGTKSKVWSDMLEMIYLAGIGEAEAHKMRWEEIDWENECINIQRQKTHNHFKVPFYAWLKPFLLRLHEAHGKPKTGQIFDCSLVCRCLTRACKALKYPNFTAKAFRKACINRLLQNGVDYQSVSRWQGHTDNGALIISTYSHILDANSKDRENAQLAKLKHLAE